MIRFSGLTVITLGVMMFLFASGQAHAETTVWNSSIIPDLYGDLGTVNTADTYPQLNWPGYYYSLMLGTQAHVSYGVRAIDMTTGTVLACDPANPSSVPVGTEVRFEFLPHEHTDISWNATGAYWDTPYGSWSAAGERTGDALCTPDRLYFTETVAACSGACQNHNRSYAELSVARPEKHVDVSGASCNTSGATKTCTLETPGSVSATFSIAPTIGKFYHGFSWMLSFGGYGTCHELTRPLLTFSSIPDGSQREVTSWFGASTGEKYASGGYYSPGEENPGSEYALSIPAQTISCPITVTDAGTPTGGGSTPTTPSLSATGASSCTTGIPHAVTMSATSPDSHPLRYLIDWDADGMTDELLPASGYVPSGTVQSSSRTYATAGQKTIKVRAQDDRGLLSPWATLSFACAAPAVTTDTDTTPDPLDGTVGTVDTSSSPDLQLRATPSLVKKGDTTRLNWSATNVSACTVSGTNGDLWDTISSLVGGNLSGAITQQTIFTLSCVSTSGTLTKRAVVNVLPTWVEN